VLIIARTGSKTPLPVIIPYTSLSRELLAHKIGIRLTLPPLQPAAVTEFVASTVTGAGAQQLARLIAEQAGAILCS